MPAYGMRISNWCSDVCSSDLLDAKADGEFIALVGVEHSAGKLGRLAKGERQHAGRQWIERPAMPDAGPRVAVLAQDALHRPHRLRRCQTQPLVENDPPVRSEEHTYASSQ